MRQQTIILHMWKSLLIHYSPPLTLALFVVVSNMHGNDCIDQAFTPNSDA